MNLTFRLADESDYKTIVEIITKSFEKYIKILKKKPSSLTTDYLPLIKNNQMYVLVNADTVIGTVVLKMENRDMWISNMAVASCFQKRGMGGKLLLFAEEMAKKQNLKNVCLYTNSRITELLEYYKKQGFTEINRKNEDGFDRVYFSKTLIY